MKRLYRLYAVPGFLVFLAAWFLCVVAGFVFALLMGGISVLVNSDGLLVAGLIGGALIAAHYPVVRAAMIVFKEP